jgi:signal transduction histidine kinase
MTHRRDYIWHTSMALAASLVLHSVAYWQFYRSEERLLLPSYWTQHAFIIVLVSTLLSFAQPLMRAQRTLVLFILLRCWFLLVLGFPMANSIGLELSLLFILLLDANRYLTYPLDVGVSLALIGAVFLSQLPVQAWKVAGETVSAANKVSLVLYPALLTSVILVMKNKIHVLLNQKEQADKARHANMELSNINLALQQHSIDAGQKARIEERTRISHELHDTVGYALTNQRMMMEAAIRQCSGEQKDLSAILEQALSQAQESLKEMKFAMRELQNVERTVNNGIDDLIKLVQAFEKTSISVDIDFRNLRGGIHPEIDRIIFRVVQEGITNAIQHGIASSIQISLWQGEREVSVSVMDNGIGCDEICEGVGLKGMRERVEKIGGSVRAANVPGGFILTARIPFQA